MRAKEMRNYYIKYLSLRHLLLEEIEKMQKEKINQKADSEYGFKYSVIDKNAIELEVKGHLTSERVPHSEPRRA